MHQALLLALLTLFASAIGTATGFGTSTVMVPVMVLFVPLPVPWVHLLFDDADVLDLWRKIHLERTARGGVAVSDARARAIIDAARTTELWDLNGLTIEEFEFRVRDARLRLRNVVFKVPGGIGRVVARVPRLRELVVTRVTAVLEPG